MRQTISVKFFARKDRAIAGGMIPIYEVEIQGQ